MRKGGSIGISLPVCNGRRSVPCAFSGYFSHEIHFGTRSPYNEGIGFSLIRIALCQIACPYAQSCRHSFHNQRDAFFLYAPCSGVVQLLAAVKEVCNGQMASFGMLFQFQACFLYRCSRLDMAVIRVSSLMLPHATRVSRASL